MIIKPLVAKNELYKNVKESSITLLSYKEIWKENKFGRENFLGEEDNG